MSPSIKNPLTNEELAVPEVIGHLPSPAVDKNEQSVQAKPAQDLVSAKKKDKDYKGKDEQKTKDKLTCQHLLMILGCILFTLVFALVLFGSSFNSSSKKRHARNKHHRQTIEEKAPPSLYAGPQYYGAHFKDPQQQKQHGFFKRLICGNKHSNEKSAFCS